MTNSIEKIRNKKSDKKERTRDLFGKMTPKGTRQTIENQKKKSLREKTDFKA